MLSQVKVEYETVSAPEFFKLILKAGLGKVRNILHETEMLGWDANCWIVEMNSGEVKAITKVDATFIEVPVDELKTWLNRTLASVKSIEVAIAAVEKR